MSQEDAPGVLQPGQVIRPVMDEENAKTLARKLFGLTVTSIKELNSYDDKNFHLQVESESSNPHIPEGHPDGYVLKVTNSLDSKNAGVMAAQNEIMLFLLARGIKVPKPEKNVTGSHFILSEITGDKAGEEGENLVRLLTFLPGKILSQVPYTAQLFFELGALVARVDNELRDFHNEAVKQRRLIWCLESAPELSKFLFAVKDEGRRRLVEEVLEAWQTTVVPLLPTLERGFIHGDCSDYNIIVSDNDEDPSAYHISLIDFGDIQHSCYVFELAIIIMYLMLEVRVMPPDEAAGHALAGYLTQRAVTEDEWSILKECIAVRFAQSLVMGAYSYMQDPGNEYLQITAVRGWEVLGSLWQTPKDQLLAQWKSTLKSYQ
ncbi:hydroxylysine kinase-like [Eriocheir sinensis]|uniref:hydroxylysine kinase-like n=1 Tax=Eriocheir sinensis TaxID=95602 RepID=UPI0021C628F7|nr:hydroxylysine kinase-like [Eriocheir sinensis]XP_050691556.1 hydroxylysine kinase-like [Eriocheir sinensis]XP_050691557.1 hydroxylysine kinase-like [Eriocheir sinensis]